MCEERWAGRRQNEKGEDERRREKSFYEVGRKVKEER